MKRSGCVWRCWRRGVPAIVLAAACRGNEAGGKAAESESPASAAVAATVVSVTTARFVEEVEAVGTVVGRAGHVAQLAAPAATRVTRINAVVGASVAAGAHLIELDVASFDAARVSAERALDVAERASARAARLADAGVLPRKDAEAASSELAMATLNAINARRTRELAVLTAPFAGTVTRVNTVLGASVDPSQPLVELADGRTQDVVLTLSPEDAAHVSLGASVGLRAAGHTGAADKALVGTGRVTDIGVVVDSTTGGVAVRVAVVTTRRALRFGEALMGAVAVGTHADAVIVPADALVPSGEGYHVFVVDAKDVAHATDVEVGGRSSAGVWIRSGLKAGDRLVTTGAYGVDDKATVLVGKR